jgi:hypothetical protein
VVIREVPFTRTQVSHLGQRLAPPPDPQYHPDVPPAPSRGGLIGWVVLLVLIGLAAGVFGLLMTGYSIVSIGSYSLTDNTLFYIFFGIFIFVGALAFIGGAVLLGILGTRGYQKKYQEYQDLIKKIAQEVENVNSDWKRALNRWDQLYYCSRDDCVFIPGDNSSAPISQLKEYVYK